MVLLVRYRMAPHRSADWLDDTIGGYKHDANQGKDGYCSRGYCPRIFLPEKRGVKWGKESTAGVVSLAESTGRHTA